MQFFQNLESEDEEIFSAIKEEKNRQNTQIELIASENFASKAVMEAQGSILTNKYAEGYPNKRYYGGCEFVDHNFIQPFGVDTKPIFSSGCFCHQGR